MTATALDLSQIVTDALSSAATFRTLIGVYSSAQVDALLAGLDGLTAEDIDTLAEINAILTDANLASISYVDGLAANYATAAQGALADTALQPSDITSGTITAGTGDIDFDSLGGGAESPLTLAAAAATETPLTVQAAASQTANLQEWKNSSGTILAKVNSSGGLVGPIGDTSSVCNIYSSYQTVIYFGATPCFSIHSSTGVTVSKSVRIGWTGGIHATQGGAGLGFEWVDATTAKLTTGVGGGKAKLELASLNLSSIPTSDPAVAGDLWNDSGTLKISAG